MEINYDRPSVTGASAVQGTLAEAAEAQVMDVLAALAMGELEHYGTERRRSRVFYLALNGPDVRITFDLGTDGTPHSAVIIYTDRAGQSATPVPEPYVERLYRALSAFGS